MSKKSNRVTAVSATALALALILTGTAFAITSVFPTVSLSAHQAGDGHKVATHGTYNPKSSKCHGPGGRTVSLTANNGQSATTGTNGSGKYSKQFGHFKFGHTYTIRAFVPGSVKSGYGNTTICYDAVSTVSVRFKK
jgi:hypothetical protein